MQSKATTVDEYLSEVPIERLQALTKLRELCRKELKGYDERVAYGSLCYAKKNIIEVGFSSQKAFHRTVHFKARSVQPICKRIKRSNFWKRCCKIYKTRTDQFYCNQKDVSRNLLIKGYYLRSQPTARQD